MEYTENYHLPQWAEEDRILREDFNAAMAGIETGITAAQTAADIRRTIIGTYTGNGLTEAEGGLKIPTALRPRFIIISQGRVGNSDTSDFFQGEAAKDGAWHYVDFLEDGFQIYYVNGSGGTAPARINDNGKQYSYVAFC